MRQSQKQWLDVVCGETGQKLTQIAKSIGRPASTLTRFYNDDAYGGVLSPTIVQAVTDATGIAGPGAVLPSKVTLREDGVLYSFDEGRAGSRRDAVVAALIGDNLNASAWRITTDNLKLANVGNGDVAIVDQSIEPRDGDLVCAQIEQGISAKTVFRLYQRPAIVGASLDPLAVKPEVVDGSRVRIAGVVTGLVRFRQ